VHSGGSDFEAMLGGMVIFTTPEETARPARPFWV